MIPLLALAGLFSMQHGVDDEMFFNRFKDDRLVIYAACKTSDGARAIFYYDKIGAPDFVEIVNGRVARMATISMQGAKFVIGDSSGGEWTLARIREAAEPMMSLPLHRGDMAGLREALYNNGSNLQACEKQ